MLKPGPPPKSLGTDRHRRKRSRYSENEVHSSQATIEEEDLPSVRLEKSPRLTTMGVSAIRKQTYE